VYITRQGELFYGSPIPDCLVIPDPPNRNYKLKSDWYNNLDNPWELDLNSFKERLIKLAKDTYDKKHEELIFKYYPKYEPFSWYYQKEEAESWLALDAPGKQNAIELLSYPWLFNACYPDGGDIEVEIIDAFASKVIDKAKNFKLSASKILGLKRKWLKGISEANTEEELLEIEKEINDEGN
jgi:hypothetical protein